MAEPFNPIADPDDVFALKHLNTISEGMPRHLSLCPSTIKAACFCLLLVLLTNCFIVRSEKAAKDFSYVVSTYASEKNKPARVVFEIHFISYGGYLIEFNRQAQISDTLHPNTATITSGVRYDTLGLYLLDPGERRFFEFDRFSETASIIRSGLFSQKTMGFRLNDTVSSDTSFYKTAVWRDTVLWQLPLSYWRRVEKSHDGSDSSVNFLYVYRKGPFLSVYDLGVDPTQRKRFSVVGFQVYHYPTGEEVVSAVERMRPLTREEGVVCEGLLKKASLKNERLFH